MALAGAPSTGSYLKQPTRASLASFSQSSRIWKSRSVSPGKPTMKVERMARSGQMSRQRARRSSVFSWCAGRRMAFRTAGEACWKGMSRIGQDLALGHQRQHMIDVRIGVDVVQAHPGAERAQRSSEVEEAGRRAARPFQGLARILDVEAVGRRCPG
jgi:hypothetical protein